mmetsp:Transcript_101364/g.315977  ORF Transcript_101364/g.315977 Transcript_101364/m.315977 type:complete len:269 (-) Transcript_101364:299-1105(-)
MQVSRILQRRFPRLFLNERRAGGGSSSPPGDRSPRSSPQRERSSARSSSETAPEPWTATAMASTFSYRAAKITYLSPHTAASAFTDCGLSSFPGCLSRWPSLSARRAACTHSPGTFSAANAHRNARWEGLEVSPNQLRLQRWHWTSCRIAVVRRIEMGCASRIFLMAPAMRFGGAEPATTGMSTSTASSCAEAVAAASTAVRASPPCAPPPRSGALHEAMCSSASTANGASGATGSRPAPAAPAPRRAGRRPRSRGVAPSSGPHRGSR